MKSHSVSGNWIDEKNCNVSVSWIDEKS